MKKQKQPNMMGLVKWTWKNDRVWFVSTAIAFLIVTLISIALIERILIHGR